jgi:hypothetical protein
LIIWHSAEHIPLSKITTATVKDSSWVPHSF